MNSSFGVGPEFSGSGGTGPSIYPRTTLGSRVEFKPSRTTVARFAVLAHGSTGGGVVGPRTGGGALLVGEMAFLARPDTGETPRERRFLIGRGFSRQYTGKVVVGGWYYTARYPDLVDTLATDAPMRHRGSRGAYLLADQTVWSAANGGPGSLSAFAQLGVGDARVDRTGAYVGGGLTRTAPFAARPKDALGLGVAAALIGSQARRAAAPRTLAGAETTVELVYAHQLGPSFAVQPDVQYVMRPNGLRAVRNAWVPGVRFALSH